VDPIDLQVTGRGKLTAVAHVSKDGVVIRLDDDANPEFWAEVRLGDGVLAGLVQSVLDLQADDAEASARPAADREV
jgi:hypothetical protein